MTAMAQSFEQRYQALTDEELLQLALERQDMVAAASAALEAQLALRGLGEEALQDFRNRQLTEVAPEEVVESQSERLPAPVELPEDWFDQKPAAPTPSLAPSRPKGVTVCAYVFWLSGAFNAAWGAWMIAVGSGTGALVMVIGVLQFMAACGLWHLKFWARKLAVVLCCVVATLMGTNIVIAAVMRLRGIAAEPVLTMWQFWIFFWQVLWALYLGGATARKAFLAGSPIEKA